MKTLCYQLWGNFYNALWTIKEAIHCFIDVNEEANEVYVTCQKEDVAFVERVFAPYV